MKQDETMEFKRNITFTSLIKVNGRLCEFNFRKRSELSYDVDTSDQRGNRVFLKMEKQGVDWKLVDITAPEWLLQSEELIDAAIKSGEL